LSGALFKPRAQFQSGRRTTAVMDDVLSLAKQRMFRRPVICDDLRATVALPASLLSRAMR